METRLSSKGQVVIPRKVREELNLQPGTVLRVHVDGRRIVLEPVSQALVAELYGMFEGVDMLSDLEEEHAREVERD